MAKQLSEANPCSKAEPRANTNQHLPLPDKKAVIKQPFAQLNHVAWEDLDPEIKRHFSANADHVKRPSNKLQRPLEPHLLKVFDIDQVLKAQSFASVDEKQYDIMRPVYDAASENAGLRELPLFDAKILTARLRQLAAEMPNFSPVIDYMLAEFGFLLTGKIQDFRMEPILLVGEPGLGKTRFVGRFAEILGIDYEKISAGTLQTSGDLGGSSRVWSNTRPGRIARLIAESKQACPIILWDEIDKLSQSDNYPIVPVILELLEPDTAKYFRDECIEIRFDASRIIHVATANDLESIDKPICSRFRIIEISAPDPMQRRSIISNVFKEILCGREFEIEEDVINRISEIDIDMRELRRQLRESVGRALLNNERCLRIDHLNIQVKPARARIGFI